MFDYRKHKNTYFSFLKDDQIVCYEKFFDDNQKYNEFKKVCKFFDIKYNKTKFDKVLLNVTKKALYKKLNPENRYAITKSQISLPYNIKKWWFRRSFKNLFNKSVQN